MAAELYWRGRKNDHLVAQRKTQWRLAHKSSAGKARSSGYKNEKGESMGQHHVRKSCVRFVVLSVSFSAVLSFTAQAATAPVGATPGSFSVDPNGGANYTIPIQIPPGSAGMAPSIALSYSKQVDNPLVGVGFSIFGLSIISRCGSTIALDGAKSGVYYDSRDRFCLDGQRLIAVNGAYGAHNTEYRTERESFAKIFSYNTSVCGLDNGAAPSSGPACFKVLSKDGTVSEYGVSPDSRIQAAPKNGVVQTTVRLWALNKVQDTRGNYYIVSYAEDNTNGEYRPVRIDYTGNANAALAPYNSVRFVYGPRTDIVPVYEAGSMIKVTQRLTNAQTYTDTTLVRDYRLGYDNNGAVGGSRLLSVTECGSDGVCLPGTTFSYQNGNTGFTLPNYNAPALPASVGGYNSWNNSAAYMYFADFNGDGKLDYMWGPQNGDGRWLIAYGTGTGFTLPDPNAPALPASIGGYNSWNSQAQYMHVADFNGDGKLDYMWGPQNGGGFWLLAYGTGTGFTLPNPNAPALPASIGGYNSWNNSAAYMYFADFNGDGKLDYMWGPQNGDGRWLMASSAGLTPDLLVNATTGLGVVTNITSKPLTDNSVYTKESGATYPYQDVQNATYVVSRVTQSDGIAGVRGTSYRYLGAKSHLTGPGWLGFRRMETTDELSGVVSITEYDQNYEAGTNGMPTLLQTKLAARTLKQVQNFWQGVATTDPAYPAASQVRFAKLNGTLEQNFEPNLVAGSDLISCVSADNTFGAYGDITQTIARTDASCSFASAWVKTTTSSYCPGPGELAISKCLAPSSRILGRLSRAQVTASALGVLW